MIGGTAVANIPTSAGGAVTTGFLLARATMFLGLYVIAATKVIIPSSHLVPLAS